MDTAKKRQTFLLIALALALLIFIALLLIFVVFKKGKPPSSTDAAEEKNVAEIVTPAALTDEELYDAYDPAQDPAHPVLDERVSVSISTLGNRPGEARPQDIEAEYPVFSVPPAASPTPEPTPAPSATLNPGGLFPGLEPSVSFPGLDLPDLYITSPAPPDPGFTGRAFELTWEYTGGRKLLYTVSISTDGGSSFEKLASGLSEKSYAVTLPEKACGACVLRVTGTLDGMDYGFADTKPFAVVQAPEPAPTIIADYVDPQVRYTNAEGMRINSALCEEVWFKAENSAQGAAKLVWQLSVSPFWGTAESFGAEQGVVAEGEVDPALGGEFPVDMKAVCDALAEPSAGDEDNIYLSARSVYSFYLRVFALDAGGEPIGDPGGGIYFQYGAAEIIPGAFGASMEREPNIQLQLYVPYYWEHRWERVAPAVLNRDLGDDAEYLRFMGTDGPYAGEMTDVVSGIEDAVDTLNGAISDALGAVPEGEKGAGSYIISHAVQVELQVATSPFSGGTLLGLAAPAGLVYSYLDTAPDIARNDEYGSVYYSTSGHGIEYDQFVPTEAELEAMGGIYYYVRAIFYVPDKTNPSVLHPYPSETVTIAFRATDASKNEVRQITVRSDIPYVQFVQYNPIKWQHSDYDEYFEVTRHVEASEMTFSLTQNGKVVVPSCYTYMTYGLTLEEYQALLDEKLPPGAVIRYVKGEPGFWERFFDLLKSIYTSVANAYADAKASVVSLVDYIPLIGDDARGFLKKAAAYAIDYGLASIGLPPSLPNIDQLAEGGIDYVMKVAVDEALRSAGVPADSPAAQEITEQVREQVAQDLTNELENALIAQMQNPLNVGFLRLDTSKLYAPAYVDVFVCNYSATRATRPGELFFSSGNSFDVYKTACVYIPALEPGEHVTIRVYLDHYRNENVTFDEKYNGASDKPYKMLVYTRFDLPDVNIAAKEQGIAAAPLSYVTQFVYDHDAYSYRYERDFIPAEGIYISDSAPDTQDFLD